jgi:hypothetical protein
MNSVSVQKQSAHWFHRMDPGVRAPVLRGIAPYSPSAGRLSSAIGSISTPLDGLGILLPLPSWLRRGLACRDPPYCRLSGLRPCRPLHSISEPLEPLVIGPLVPCSPRYWSGIRGVGGMSRAGRLPMLVRVRCPGGRPYGMRLYAEGGYICPLGSAVLLRGRIIPGSDCVEAAASWFLYRLSESDGE